MSSKKIKSALSTARRYAKKAGGGGLDDGFYVTPGGGEEGATRIIPRDFAMGAGDTNEQYKPMPWGSDPWTNRLGPTKEMIEERKAEDRATRALRTYREQSAENLDESLPYRGMPRLDPGLRREPGSVEPTGPAKTFGEVGGDMLTDPINFVPLGYGTKAAQIASQAAAWTLGLTDEAEAGGLKTLMGLTKDQLIDFGEAITAPKSGKAGANLAKSLKQPFPKDLAVEALKQGLEADELANLTSYLSPGAEKAFWKWHKKLYEQYNDLTPENVMAPLNKQVDEVLAPPKFDDVKVPPQIDVVKLANESLSWSPGQLNQELSKMSEKDAELLLLVREQLLEGQGVVKPQIIGDAPKAEPPPSSGIKLPKKPEGYGQNFGDYIASPTMMTKIDGQKGSNPGGVFRDNNGNKFYIKEGLSKDHVRNELTAASLYNLAGVPTFKYRPVFGDKHIATEWQNLPANNLDQLTAPELKRAKKDFAIHAWLGNYDAIGTGGDNIGVFPDRYGNSPGVLDTGGALEYRAQGKPKTDFGTSVTEIDTMRDPSINSWSAKVFGDMTDDEIRKSVQKVADIPDAMIEDTIKAHGGSDALAKKMVARKHDLMKRFGVTANESKDRTRDLLMGDEDMFRQEPLPKDQWGWDEKPNRAFEPEGPEGWGTDKSYMNFSQGEDMTSFLNKEEKLPEALIGALETKYGKPPSWFKASPLHIPLEKIEPTVASTKQMPADIIWALMSKGTGDTNISVWGHQGKQITKALDNINNDAIAYTLNQYKADPKKINNLLSWMSTDKKSDFLHYLSKDLEKQGYKVDIDPPKTGGPSIMDQKTYEAIREYMKPVDWQKWEPPPDKYGVQAHHTPKFSKSWMEKKMSGRATKEEVEKLGFNSRLGLFHGGKGSYAEELADPKLKKQLKIGSYHDERAFFLSDNPDISSAYGSVNTADPFVVRINKEANRPEVFEVEWKKLNGNSDYDGFMMGKLIDAGHDMGAKMIIVRGISDSGGIQTQYLVLDTSILRKTSAKFDPSKLHLAKPLAGLGGGGIFVYGTAPDRAEASPVKKFRGGTVLDKALRVSQKYAKGGALNEEGLGDPANHVSFEGGMLNSDIPGRTDKLPIKLRNGSYVIPADIPSASALGEGNTMAGKKALDHMFRPHKLRGMRLRPLKSGSNSKLFRHKAEGGGVDGEIPIIAAGGEYVVDPETVASIGDGDLEKGHSELDKFVKKVRHHNIKTLRKLAPPKVN